MFALQNPLIISRLRLFLAKRICFTQDIRVSNYYLHVIGMGPGYKDLLAIPNGVVDYRHFCTSSYLHKYENIDCENKLPLLNRDPNSSGHDPLISNVKDLYIYLSLGI